MKEIGLQEIETIAIGAAVLGTGGGGDPYIGKLIAKQAILKYGPVKVIKLDELTDEGIVMPAGSIGAPSVSNEKISAEEELFLPIDMMEEALGKPAAAIMPIEIGGGNSMIPIACAAKKGLPIIDADAMGRAFPEAQMVTFHLAGYEPEIVTMADAQGNQVVYKPVNGLWSEKMARALTVEMGGSAMMIDNVFPGKIVKKCAIPGTLSLANEIGEILLNRQNKELPAALEVVTHLNGHHLFAGKIQQIDRKIAGGFTKGEVVFMGMESYKEDSLRIYFQNELLLAEKNGQPIAMTPDLIAVLDYDTGMPITTENLKYGARVHVVAFPCNEKWRTAKGLETAGPAYFGYQVAYQPIEEIVQK